MLGSFEEITMGYKNLDHYGEFCNFLAACFEDLGYTVAEQCDEYIQVTDKNGKIKMITQADICIQLEMLRK